MTIYDNRFLNIKVDWESKILEKSSRSVKEEIASMELTVTSSPQTKVKCKEKDYMIAFRLK